MRIHCITGDTRCTVFAVDFTDGTTTVIDSDMWQGLRISDRRNIYMFVQNDDNVLPRIYCCLSGDIYGLSEPCNIGADNVCIAARSPKGVINNRDILREVGMDICWALGECSLSFEYYTGDISVFDERIDKKIGIYTRGRKTLYEYPTNLSISSHIILGDSIYVLGSGIISHDDTRTPHGFSAISYIHFEGCMRTKALSENIIAVFTETSSDMRLGMFDRRWPTQLAAQYPPISTDWIPRSVAI